MKLSFTNNNLLIALYFIMFAVHFVLWQSLGIGFETTIIRYYLFLTILFMMVLTIVSIFKMIYPEYLGFVFLGLVMFKLAMVFIIRKKLNITEIPNYKFHFILPYLFSLFLETVFTVNMIRSVDKKDAEKDEKNQ